MGPPGARTALSAVIIADEGHRGREIERLAQPLRGAEKQKGAEVAGHRREHADDAPRLEPPEDRRLTADTIHDVSCKGRADSVDQSERGAQQAELDFVEMQWLLEKRKDRKDRLPVRVVEEPAKPEHADDIPLIVRVERDSREYFCRSRGSFGCHESPVVARSPRTDSCIRTRSSGRTFSLIHTRISLPSGVSCVADRKSSVTPSFAATLAARIGHAMPISAAPRRAQSKRGQAGASLPDGEAVAVRFFEAPVAPPRHRAGRAPFGPTLFHYSPAV